MRRFDELKSVSAASAADLCSMRRNEKSASQREKEDRSVFV